MKNKAFRLLEPYSSFCGGSDIHLSVLCAFRTRLIEGHVERLLFEKMLTYLKEQGLIKAGGRQRTDAIHVLAAVRATNRVVCVGEAMRVALGSLAQLAPVWLRSLAVLQKES